MAYEFGLEDLPTRQTQAQAVHSQNQNQYEFGLSDIPQVQSAPTNKFSLDYLKQQFDPHSLMNFPNPMNAPQLSEDQQRNKISELIGNATGAGAAGLGGMKLIGGASKNILNYFRPKAYVNALLESMSQGSKSISENSRSIANDVKNSFQKQNETYKELRDPVYDKYGNMTLYPKVNWDKGLRWKFPEQAKPYRDVPALDLSHASDESKNLYELFKRKPTLKYSHELQSSLGNDIGEIRNEPDSLGKSGRFKKVSDSRNLLKMEVDKFLRNIDPSAADSISQASDHYLENVVPFKASNRIKDIAKGSKDANLKGLHNAFATPNENLSAVIKNLPKETNNKILFGKMGGTKNLSPTQVINKLHDLRGGEYSDYFTPELENHLNEISSKITKAKLAKSAALVGAGTAIGALGLNKIKNAFLD